MRNFLVLILALLSIASSSAGWFGNSQDNVATLKKTGEQQVSKATKSVKEASAAAQKKGEKVVEKASASAKKKGKEAAEEGQGLLSRIFGTK